MNTVTVSSKFQVVIPRNLRRLPNIQPGRKQALKACIQYGRTNSFPEQAMTAARLTRRHRYPG
jgi:hypothetical protein